MMRTSHPNDEKITLFERLASIHKREESAWDLDNKTEEKLQKVLKSNKFGLSLERAEDQRYVFNELGFLKNQRLCDLERWRKDANTLYIHPDTLNRHKERIRRQNERREQMGIFDPKTGNLLHDDDDQPLTLPSVEESAEARYAEGIARSKAISQEAHDKGFKAMMITANAASRFSTMRSVFENGEWAGLEPNPHSDDETLYDCYKFLHDETRTIFKRFNNTYKSGKDYLYVTAIHLSIAGTPHFHTMLFAKQSTLDDFKAIYHGYCLEVKEEMTQRRRDDYIQDISVNFKHIKSQDNSQSSAEAALNYISQVLYYTSQAGLASDNPEKIYEARCISAFSSNNRIRLVRYSQSDFTTYKHLRKATAHGLFDNGYQETLPEELEALLDTFSERTEQGRRVGRVAFYKFKRMLNCDSEDSLQANFKVLTVSLINRFKQHTKKAIGLTIFGITVYFKKYKVVPI